MLDLWQAMSAGSSGSVAALLFLYSGFSLSQIGILKKHGVRLCKSLGQHILIDDNVARKIVASLALTKWHGVIEIGSGLGALTPRLADEAGRVVAIEIDRRLASILRDEVGDYRNIDVTEGNFLKIDFKQTISRYRSITTWKVVGNLPYYITTSILLKLIDNLDYFEEAVVTVQEEFAQRLVAKPGSEDYSSLSIFVQYRFEPEILFLIKPVSFVPQPDVRSAVVRLKVLERPRVKVSDEGLFFQTIKAAFGQRRKTLKRSLRQISGLSPDLVGELDRMSGVGLERRPETLSIEEFAQLANAIKGVVG